MRTNTSIVVAYCIRPILTAGLALAMAITFGCSGDDPSPGGDPSSSTQSSSSGISSSSNPSGGSSSSNASSSSVSSSSSAPCTEAWVIKTSATCGADGQETRTCDGALETKVIPKLPITSDQFCKDGKIGTYCGSDVRSDVEYDPAKYECKSGKNGIYLIGGITDDRNSKHYDAVLIGSQVWMAENLNYKTSNGTSRCYPISGTTTSDADNANCEKYGRLYDWATAMGDADTRDVCPDGWHLPSNAEWNVLMKAVNPSCSDNTNCAGAGTKLMAKEGWNPYTGIPAGTDDFGFSALPGGNFAISGNMFDGVGVRGGWWSATEDDSNASNAFRRIIINNGTELRASSGDKANLQSVRCVQD